MAVFEYRGIVVGTGKPTKGVRDAENPKALRSALRKDGVLLTVATESIAALGTMLASLLSLRTYSPNRSP